MSKNGKPGGPSNTGAKHPGKQSTDTRSRRELLDELSSIQSLLGDAAADVDPHNLGEDDDIPTLPPAEDDDIGDAHAQIPLLGGKPTPPAAKKATPERAASKISAPDKSGERVNPFLPRSNAPTKSTHEGVSQDIEKLIAQRAQETIRSTANAMPSAGATTPAQALSAHQIRVLAEEVLSEWMPKIERDLRNRLIDALKNNH